MPGKKDKEDGAPVDKRIAWMEQKISGSLKIKAMDMKKFLENEDVRAQFSEFLDTADSRTLFIVQTPGQPLVARTTPPEEFKRKIVYFLKLTREKVSPENIVKIVSFGDMTPPAIDFLEVLANEVFLKLLTHPESMSKMNDVTVKEMLHRYHRFLAQIQVTIGLTKGKTILPIPQIDKNAKAKDVVHLLESTVVEWTAQIKTVLAQDPEQELNSGSHPGPLVEVSFWTDRAANLDNLEEQIHTRSVLTYIKILQTLNSSYFPAFASLIQEVHQQAVLANEIRRFLKPLTEYFENLCVDASGRMEFDELANQGIFRKMFHLIYIVWCNSRYYNTPTRLVVLIRELSNDLIRAAKKNVGMEDLLQIEPDEAVKRLSNTLAICAHFKNCYFHYKSKAAKESENPWRFRNTSLFARLDAFLERCHDVLDLVESFILFSRLERVEIGGTKGKQLSADVVNIHQEFKQAYDKFRTIEYDMLDVDDPAFDKDWAVFGATIQELDRRLGSVLASTFEDGIVIYSVFKVIDSFEGILDRSIVQQEWLKKQGELITTYAVDLKQVQDIYLQFKDNPAVYASMPPTACALVWSHGLMERISGPLQRLTSLSKGVLDTQEAKETLQLADSLMKLLQEYTTEKYEAWASQVGSVSIEKLKQNLLFRDETTKMLYVNFDPKLVRLLREVSYVEKLNMFDGSEQLVIPQQALALNKNSEVFRNHILALEHIVSTYNGIINTLLPVEQAMLAQELDKINQELEVGLKLLDWNAHDKVNEFIASAMHSVTSVDSVLKTLKNGVIEIEESLNQFKGAHEFFPFTAKNAKTLAPDDFAKRYSDHHKAQVADLTKRGVAINAAVQRSFEVLNEIKAANEFQPLTQEAEAWQLYVQYVNGIVQKAVLGTIQKLTSLLANQVDSEWLVKNNGIPLLDIKLLLVQVKSPDPRVQAFEVHFSPVLDKEEGDKSLQLQVNNWAADYKNLASCIKRIDTGEDDYVLDVEASDDIQKVVSRINECLSSNAKLCRDFMVQFGRFSYLWELNMSKSFHEFLHPPKVLNEDGEEMPSPDLDPLFGVKLPLFEQQVTKYAKVYQEIMELPGAASIGWLRIDSKPIKESIKAVCNKWKAMFTGFLQEKVEAVLKDLFDFIKLAAEGLNVEVEEGGMESLKGVMGFIRDCKKRHTSTMELMEPLSAVMAMLRRHNAVSEEDLERLEEMRKDAPQAWNEVYRTSLNKRESLSKIQDTEAAKIKEDTVRFDKKVAQFRSTFMQIPTFSFDLVLEDAYQDLDLWDRNLEKVETDAQELRELQELFDLHPSDFKELKDCRADLKMLKQVWDLTAHVDAQFVDWMTTVFKHVDTDFLLEEVKKLQKQLKTCSPRMKAWDCFKGLETKVKNMATSLPLVQDLRSPAMRDRHWRQLCKLTKQTKNIDPESDSFTLKDLLDLGLHGYVEDVANIVEKATKELGIEKNLKKVVDAWEVMSCTYEFHKGLNTYMLGPIEDIIEVLEDNNNLIQTMLANRFVEFFFEKVSKWQHNLGAVDTCMIKWMEVQKQWSNLYPIFMLSEDIKTQLPEQAKNFATCDELFRSMMDKAHKFTNVIEVCTTDAIRRAMGRQDTLEQMLIIMEDILTACEKALADYLETKRKIFPRFYFVSAADLVDILSKGSDPTAVLVHIGKIVDSLDTFQMIGDSKVTDMMISREGEQVKLAKEFCCEGPVEDWLTGIIESMFMTIKSLIADGYTTYVENPRTAWIFLYPAQIVCYVTRIWYTLETHQAFDQMEDGNEQAMKDFLKQQKAQLDGLITLVLGELTKGDRKKLVTLITIDVHSRDVIGRIVDEKVDNSTSFQWVSQLRYYWDDKKGSVINICDAEFINGYEYIGNCGCLVITALTDRCYITLTQALKLRLGGAPAGPAGTGKTETTK
eukprot:EG_transcript_150